MSNRILGKRDVLRTERRAFNFGILGVAVDLRPFPAAEWFFLRIARDPVLSKFWPQAFKDIAERPEDPEVSEDRTSALAESTIQVHQENRSEQARTDEEQRIKNCPGGDKRRDKHDQDAGKQARRATKVECCNRQLRYSFQLSGGMPNGLLRPRVGCISPF